MTQYISKSVIVAEIERRRTFHDKYRVIGSASKSDEDIAILSFIDTLEVKEVDLDCEVEKCLKKYQMLAVGKKDFTCIAKHFFELGLKAQKGES